MTYGDPIPADGDRTSQPPPQQPPAQQSAAQGPFGGPSWPTQPTAQVPPQGPGYGYPGSAATPRPPVPQPDWNALADQHERDSKRGKWRLLAAVGGAFVLGTVTGGVAVKAVDGGPSAAVAVASGRASGSPTALASPSSSPPSPVVTRLDDAAGSVPLSVGSGAKVTDVQGARALQLTGTADAFAAGPNALVDTKGSFTVSAWVLNQDFSDTRAAVTQGDHDYYAFDLGREFRAGKFSWMFKVQSPTNKPGNPSQPLYARAAAAPGAAWTLLTGTYDAKSRNISLYVDGRLAQTTRTNGVWPYAGALQVGRVRYKSSWTDDWIGAIRDVRVWPVALSPAQVAATAKAPGVPAPAHAWLVS
ncbi:hypothetical protein ABIA32_000016 [Streptacidiphilus sp. MAP12-20]|uniref:LamG domain-containing protein n=1 Tax=Streptacidiphilus sp. MAP12-20 TaxID=3156299 RepID=UPI0035111BC8